MHEFVDELYALCETLENDLAKTNEKLRMAGGEMSGSDLEYVDKLTHAIKSVKTTLAMAESDGEYSYEGGSYARGGQGGGRGGNRGGSYAGGSNAGGQGGSYARGRGRNARRDSMGRYSREGYSRADEMEDMVESIRGMMQQLPQDVQRDAERFVQKLEQQM